jgi:anaerobic selenocysteine-containing dehydrogenase
MVQIGKRLKQLYADSTAAKDLPIKHLVWDYDDPDNPNEFDHLKVLKEINGYDVATGKPVSGFGALQDDGSTACGCWIYAGYFDNFETPKCRSRVKDEPGTTLGTHLGWAWAWPVNRRILYNRCSMDEHGQPWDPERPLFRWDGEKFIAQDVPDFVATNPPEVSAQNPFIMMQEGVGALWSPSGMKDGPIPEHYEPVESPVSNRFNRRQFNPVAVISGKGEFGALTEAENPEFPYICTTYRVTEHWQSGAMTRSLPWLGEMMPDMFVEISPTLAAKLGVQPGDRVEVTTVRGSLVAPAMVTPRMRPVRVHGREIEIVGMPWHWGFMGKFTGASANVLTPHVGDANTQIPEYKAFLCNVRKAGGSGPVRG